MTGAVLIVSAACGLPIGYSTILLPQLLIREGSNSTQTTVIDYVDPMSFDWGVASWITSIHSAASPIGSFLSGPIMDRWGRRTALLFSILPLILGWAIIALSHNHFLLILGRIVCGMSVGLIAAPAQILIAEIAEPNIRGMLVGSPFVFYSLGILFVYFLGSYFAWRTVAWCGIILPVLSWIAIYFSPETPTWLTRNDREKEALEILKRLRKSDKVAEAEVKDLTDRFRKEQLDEKNTSLWDSVKQIPVIKALIIINLFNSFQVLSGTYLVVFYAVDIIKEFTHGDFGMDSLQAAILTAVTRLLVTIVYCFLLLYMNRRTMLNWMGTGSAISSIVISILLFNKDNVDPKTLVIVGAGLVILYITTNTAFFVMPGILVGELLPSKIRGRIAGYIFTYFNILLFAIAKLFPSVVLAIGIEGIFLIFGIASLLTTGLCILMLPETRGKSLSEIEDYFKEPNWLWLTRKTN